MTNIRVISPGILTTVQDRGRYGYQELGVPVSGAMDDLSFRLANILVGNDQKEAELELTYSGPSLQFDADTVVAITGADMSPKLEGKVAPMYESFLVKKDQTLSFGKLKSGIRAYIAFGGSIDVALVNGSKSTQTKIKMGGFQGRPLKAKDVLKVKVNPSATCGKVLKEKYRPKNSKFAVIRAVLGPQDDYFTQKGIHDLFVSGGYMISKEFDRMGIRLKGSKIEHKETADIISDGTVFGSIQVPANGEPIILMADRQTTVGYTKIATVISADLPKLAQMQFLDKIIFQEVGIEEAQEITCKYEENFKNIIEDLK